MKKTKPAFKKGDIVKSEPNSQDIKLMGAIWNAVIYKYNGQTDKGEHVYETLGCWEPIKDKNGKVKKFWKDYKADWSKPELRQLWENHLIANTSNTNS